MTNTNAAQWRPLPNEPWAVYVKRQGADSVAQRLYLAFDKSADAKAGRPFVQAEAEAFAGQINEQVGEMIAVALPLEQTLQPGI